MNNLYSVLSVFFAFFALSNLLKGDYSNSAGGFLIAGLLYGYVWYAAREKRKTQQFITFLRENWSLLEAGSTIYYRGVPLQTTTGLVRYSGCFSVLLLTQKFSSPLYIKDEPHNAAIGWGYSVFSLLLGWWGIPFGPIYTIQTVYRNARGGYEWTVTGLLTQLAAEEAEAAEDAAEAY